MNSACIYSVSLNQITHQTFSFAVNTADHEWAENTAASEAADDDTNKDISNEEKIFMSKNQAMSYLQHKRTVYSDGSSVGIVCECCTHQCSLGELAQYCQGGRSAFHSKRSWKPEYHKPDSFASRSANKITDITDTDHPQSHDKTGESLHTTSDQNKEFTQMILASMFPQRKLHAV